MLKDFWLNSLLNDNSTKDKTEPKRKKRCPNTAGNSFF